MLLASLVLAAALQEAAPAAQPADAGRPAPGPVITAPDWVRLPSAAAFADLYPMEAARSEVSGRATISCSVTAEGALVDCRVITEAPLDYGFGDAALKMATMFQMRPQSKDGQPVAGGTVRIPIRFGLPGLADPLSGLIACYGETAAAAERDASDTNLNYAFGFFAAQVAVREGMGKSTPETFESSLTNARKSALARKGPPTNGPTLEACLALIPKMTK